MINFIWFFLIISGLIISFFTQTNINDVILNAGSDTLKVLTTTVPLIVLWSGLINIAEESGLLQKLSFLLKPFLKKIMPSIKSPKAFEYISSNIVANIFGLGSVATPFGLKAMQELQNENKNKTEASPAMITFLVLNTSGLTIIPTMTLALRSTYNSLNVSKIIIPGLITTAFSTIMGLILDAIIRSKNAK